MSLFYKMGTKMPTTGLIGGLNDMMNIKCPEGKWFIVNT